MLPKEYNLKLLEIIQETQVVKLFRFEYPDDAEFKFYPGQFMMVSFIDDSEIKYGRAYSLASSPENRECIEIGLDKVARFTEKMFMLEKGAVLRFRGPYGKFYFDDGIKNSLVLIGGGTGITPLIGIIRYCTDKKSENRIKLVYSVKKPEFIIYRNELERIKKENRNFDYAITITRPNESDNWNGRKGRVDSGFLKEYIEDTEGSAYFLCGPNDFTKRVIALLESLGAKKEQIKTDIWG